MCERFTFRARKVMMLANHEAKRFRHEYIGTEHILLGLVKEGSGVAATVLKHLDVDLRKIRFEVEKLNQSGPEMVTIGRLPQTPRAKKAIEYAIAEARQLCHNHVGTEHLLLGLLREEEGCAAQVLMNFGLTLDTVRRSLSRGQRLAANASPRELRAVWNSAGPDLPEVRYFNAEIERLTQEKETAVADQDFDKAAHLRDQCEKWKTMKEQFVSKWWGKVGPIPELPGVEELDTAIQQTLKERMSAIARCDSVIEKLNAEKARIINEWCKQQAAKIDPPKSGGTA
jgi:ATP-dependent Clp protease ATP-binding subunit ClpA